MRNTKSAMHVRTRKMLMYEYKNTNNSGLGWVGLWAGLLTREDEGRNICVGLCVAGGIN